MIACKSYMKHEDVPENKKLLVYGFKNIETDKDDNYIIIGCELDDFFKFWFINCINEKIETRDVKIRAWLFLTLVKRNIFFKIQSLC